VRAVVGRPATLRWQLTDDVGDVLTPTGSVTVSVVAGDGATPVAGPLTATLNATNEAYEVALPPQSQLDTLTATWSAPVAGVAYSATTVIDVVAQRLVDPYILRQDSIIQAIFSGAQGPLQLVQLMDQVEEGIRYILGYPPVLEGFRTEWDTLRGTLNDALYVSGTVNGLPYGWGAGKMRIPGTKIPVQIYSGTINGVALDPINDVPKLNIENGMLVWADYRPWISGRYQWWGTHGESNPAADLRWAAKKLCHHFAQTSDFPDRAYSITTEAASILFSMPSPDRPTGIPEVDAVLNRLRLESVI
jgi:hypothetical protein